MTPLWTAEALRAATGGVFAGTPSAITGISIDTRTLRPGDLFVALHSDTGDGHDHVATALQRGAVGAMVDRSVPDLPADAPVLRVSDTTRGLTDLGAAGRARFAGPVIAITGSVGKTTTKAMLALCLARRGANPHAAEASHNNHWGVPLTLARLPTDATSCIVEIGMNHAGEIAPLSRLTAPTIALVTHLGSAHIGHLETLEAIADEKAAIADGLAEGGTAILPADAPLLDRLRAGLAAHHRVITFGASAFADAHLTMVHAGPDHCALEAWIGGQHVAFHLHAPGRHMALNALAALAATHAAGFDVQAAARALEAFSAGPGRGAKSTLDLPGGTAVLLDESYNASPASVRAALSVLALQPATRRIAVLGDMRELGRHSGAEHRGLAASVGAAADLVFTCGPEMRALHDALPASPRTTHADTAEATARCVAAAIRPGDAVLVKGSNGMRMRVVVAALGALDQPHAGAA